MKHLRVDRLDDTIKSKVVKQVDLIDYQSDSIVSKTIINSKNGTVTLFAFDEGQGLSEHTAAYDALLIILEGKSEIKISGKSHILKKDEMIIMPANKPHAVKALKKFKMILILIKP
jgi:quercetin dioxygenase-like cupin family protein